MPSRQDPLDTFLPLFRNFAFLLVLSAAAPRASLWAAEPRTWHDNTDAHQVQATLVDHDDTKVRLRRADGRVFDVPLQRLSKADQDYLKSLRAPNPFETAEDVAAVTDAADALVIVVFQLSNGVHLAPGVVFKKDKKSAYVRATRLSAGLRFRSGGDLPLITIIWEKDGKRQRVEGRMIAENAQANKCVVAAPADKMPDPLVRRPDAKIVARTPVTVIGYEIDRSSRPPSFARLSGFGTLASIFRDADGTVAKLHIEGENVATLQGGLVLNEQGVPIGIDTLPMRNSAKAFADLAAAPIRDMPELEAPSFHYVRFAPRSGDEQKIEFEFVACMADPFGKLKSAALLVRPHDGRTPPGSTPRVLTPLRPKDGPPPKLDDATPLRMTKGQPSEVVARQLPGQDRLAMSGELWIGRHEIPNPGPVRDFRYLVQFVYETKSGETVYTDIQNVGYDPSYARRLLGMRDAKVVPDIPGLDGRPLNMPRPVQLEDGGWKLTSRKTRVEENPAAPLPADLPKPVQSGASRLDKTYAAGEFDAFDLTVKAHSDGSYGRGRAPMVFSADGRWLYVIDGDNVLRQIGTENFEEKAYLELGAASDDITLSKEGLMVALGDTGVIRLVDGDTLQVKRQIAVPDVKKVAGSPGSSIGFATSVVSLGPHRRTGQLLMIDLAQGRPIHAIRTLYDGQTLMFGDRRADRIVETFQYLALHLSHDGNYLYGAMRSIHRFRVDGEDLIYEESTKELYNGHTTHFVVSGDGKWTAMPTGAGNGGGSYSIAVYDTQDLSAHKLVLANGAYPNAIGFDPKTGNMYTPNSDVMNVFGPRGGKVSEFKCRRIDNYRIIVHPEGERFVLWTREKLIYFDTVAGRLMKSTFESE